jgi:succinyl-CoA synthetase beta subunit
MTTLSEAASKRYLAPLGVPFATERMVRTPDDAVAAARGLGFPVVVKLGGTGIAHKTERGLVRLGLRDGSAVARAAEALLQAATPEDGEVHLLVAEQLTGARELIAGLVRDVTFGPCVMLGIGGVLAEAVGDVAFRRVPFESLDAEELIDDLRTSALLGPFRGEPRVDRDALVRILLALSAAGVDESIASVDLNPLVVRNSDGVPIAVDALVERVDDR